MTRAFRPSTARLAVAGILLVVAASGCATVKAASARSSALQAEFQDHPLPRSCDALWPDALRVAAKRGFALSPKDKALLGETPDGFIAQAVSAATQTYRLQDGGLTASTDWNRESGTRLRITGNPAGENACKVRYDVVAGGVTTADEQEMGPDWNYVLDLLQVLDPAAAAAVEGRIPPPR
jgi:hypothetical protein